VTSFAQHSTASRPNVLHVISGLGQGGAEMVMYRLLTSTQQQVQHQVISLGGMDEFGPRLQEQGIEVEAFNLSGRTMLTRGRAPLLAALERVQPDVIQTWMYHSNALASWWAYRAGYQGKIVWNIRNSGQHMRDFSLISRLSLRAGAWLSTRVPTAIVCCAQSAAKRHQELGYDGSKMRVIANGLDSKQWYPDPEQGQIRRRQMRIETHMPVIGVVARWHALKDWPNTLRALGQVVEQYPNVRCLLIGGDIVQTNKALMTLIRAHKLENNVLLLGQREDVAQWMQAMDIFVLGSKAEGFPNVVCEAMATELRCVVTDVGDAAMIVGQEGLVVPPSDADALAQGIRTAIHDLGSDSHRRVVTAGRQRIQNDFSLEKMQNAYLQLWQEVAAAQGSEQAVS